MPEAVDVAIRYVVLVSSTLLLLFVLYTALNFLWQKPDQNTFAVRPFVIVDPKGEMTSGEAGLARMLIARVNELQNKSERSNAVLDRARRDENVLADNSAARTFDTSPEARWSRFDLSDGWITSNKLELEFQGIDFVGVLSWFAQAVLPNQKSLTFTLSVNGTLFGAAGDVSALGIDGVPTNWIEPDHPSVHDAIDELALQLVRLRVTEKNRWMRDLEPKDFRTLIDAIPRTENMREAFHAAEERERHFREVFSVLEDLLKRFKNLPGLTIVTAETARLSGNLGLCCTNRGVRAVSLSPDGLSPLPL